MTTHRPSSLLIVLTLVALALALAFAFTLLPNEKNSSQNTYTNYLDSVEIVRIAANERAIARPQSKNGLYFSNPELIVMSVVDVPTDAELSARQDELIHASAVVENDLKKCDGIANEAVANECRSTIRFWEAIAEKNSEKCELITADRSKLRCKNYVALMVQDAQ